MTGFQPPTTPGGADLASLFDLTPDVPAGQDSAPPQPRQVEPELAPVESPAPIAAAPPANATPLQPKSHDLPSGLTPGGGFTAPQDGPAALAPTVAGTPPGTAGLPSQANSTDTRNDAAWKLSQSRRVSESARLWPIADTVLASIGSDPTVQVLANNLVLERDPIDDARQRAEFFEALKPRLALSGVQIPDPRDVEPVLSLAYDEILGISVLGDLWRDPDITEIMVDRWDRIVIERDGKLQLTDIRFRDAEHANAVARSLAMRVSDRAVSRAIPLVTAELPHARVTFAYGSVVKGGLSITIRKFRDLLSLNQLLAYESLNQQMVDFLNDAVTCRVGILVSGGTGTGKTTIINLLSSFIPDTERVLTIEDAFELSLSNTHVVSLQTKEASSSDDTVSVTLADLLRNTLRMRPDRIIVGEIREGDGASVMLSAANTGHDGTMTTIHANSASMAVNERLPDLVRQVRTTSDDASIKRSISSAFDLVVQVSRGRGGRRYISEISAVDMVGSDGSVRLDPVFRAEPDSEGRPVFTFHGVPRDTVLAERLNEKGVLNRWVATQA